MLTGLATTDAPASDWMRVLFDAIDDAVFVHDAAGNILEANPAACRRLGYTRDEMLRLNTREVDAPEFAAGFGSRLQSQIAEGHFRCEGVHRTKDGRLVPVDINTSAIQLNGAPAVLAVIRDITQRKLAEEALHRQSHLLQSILDNMGDAIVVADAQEQVVLYNPAARRLFGAGLARGDFQLYDADRQTRLAERPFARCRRGESFDEREAFVRSGESDQGRWLSLAGRPLRDQAGAIKGGVLVGRDITDRKRADRRLSAQYAVARVLADGGEVDEVARRILHVLGEAMDFDAGVLWAAEPGGHGLCCLQVWQLPGPALADFLSDVEVCVLPEHCDPATEAWRKGTAVFGEVARPPWDASPRGRAARDAGLARVLAFPVRAGQPALGVLEFWGRAPVECDDSVLAMMQAMGAQIGQFLERQRVERALRDSEALYHSLVQGLPQNIFRKDRAGRVTFGNQRYCETLKMPLEELLGKTDFDLFPAELARKYVADDKRIMETGRSLDVVEQHHLPGGETIYVQVVKTPVYDARGEAVGVQGIFWDVTEQVRAEQALTQSEKRYRQLAEATLDGIVLVGEDGRVELFNPAAERMFGYTSAEAVGEPASLLAPDEFGELCSEGALHYAQTRLARAGGRATECTGRRKDGSEFPVEIAVSLLTGGPDDAGRGFRFLIALRDLTERNKMRAVLLQNEKLASIGLLSAGVAHEINNPLAFVGNNLAVLERDCKGLLALVDAYRAADQALARVDPPLAEQVRALAEDLDLDYVRDNLGRLLERTRDGVDRVSRIVHSLRGMARTDAPRRQMARLPELVESSLEILRGKFKRLGVTVEQEHDPEPFVPCVPTQLSQVILNLLVNAFQAVEASHTGAGVVRVRTRRCGGEMLVEVSDNGCGIDSANASKLFDPFFTTKDVGEGTGLGLSISHHIITAHGGRIEVESTPDVGTTFRVYLPLHDKDRP